MMNTVQPPAVAIANARKAYGATIALDDVSVSITAGSVHALLGENGAGKSTLVKILSGLVTPDTGSFEIFGQPARLTSPRIAHAAGIQTAFQEMTQVRDLTVLDNILMPYAPVNFLGIKRHREAERRVNEHLAEIGLHDIDLGDEISELDLSVRQKIEIGRALFRKPRILLLDEPTSTLSGSDVDWLGKIIAQQKAAGVTVVFISHRLREVREFCDHLTILRGGRHIDTGDAADYGDEDIVRMIAGRSLIHSFPPRTTERHDFGPEVLRAEKVGTAGKLREASFVLRQGEILGVAGLQGMGQLDLFLATFGMVEITQGHFAVDGQQVAIASPKDAVSARIGISLVPEDRKTEALFLKLSGKHNASLPVIERFVKFGLIDNTAENAAVEKVFERVEVDQRALWSRADSFSGGNQQKIAIAKWLLAESRVLLVYDPTRGIDVGTKNELYQLLRTYAAAGGAVLFYSTEIAELVHLADRVMVFYAGTVAAELSGESLNEENILRHALGSADEDRKVA